MAISDRWTLEEVPVQETENHGVLKRVCETQELWNSNCWIHALESMLCACSAASPSSGTLSTSLGYGAGAEAEKLNFEKSTERHMRWLRWHEKTWIELKRVMTWEAEKLTSDSTDGLFHVSDVSSADFRWWPFPKWSGQCSGDVSQDAATKDTRDVLPQMHQVWGPWGIPWERTFGKHTVRGVRAVVILLMILTHFDIYWHILTV